MINFLTIAFNAILYRPIFNALILLYEYLPGHDFGVAIIVLTCIIRLLLYPSTIKSIKSQKALQEIQPKIKEVQAKFKDDKGEQAKAVMDLYKKEKINPLSGCLPLLIQLPILIALFLALKSLAANSDSLSPDLFYSFVPYSGNINHMFLGIMDITKASAVLAVLAGISQFFQSKMMTASNASSKKTGDFSQMMQKQMLYFFPVFTVLILWRLPSAIGLYWMTTSLFSIGQQYLILNSKNPKCSPDKNS